FTELGRLLRSRTTSFRTFLVAVSFSMAGRRCGWQAMMGSSAPPMMARLRHSICRDRTLSMVPPTTFTRPSRTFSDRSRSPIYLYLAELIPICDRLQLASSTPRADSWAVPHGLIQLRLTSRGSDENQNLSHRTS